MFSDGLGSIEENIFSTYFTDGEIRDAGAVIDLGAHHRSFSVYAALKSSPGSAKAAVEPNPLAAELCAENLSSIRRLIKQKRLRVKILRSAVWRSEGDIYLELSRWSEAHTVGDRPRGRRLRAKASTLDEILKEAGGDAIAKMDTEGAEYEALRSSNLRGVRAISIEAHSDPADLAKILKMHTEIRTYNIRSNLATAWLRVRPRSYGLLAALYRLTASQTATPTVTIVKGTRT